MPENNVKFLTFTTFEFCTMCIYYLFNNKTKIVTKPSKQNTNSILIKLGVKHAPCTLLGLPMGQEQMIGRGCKKFNKWGRQQISENTSHDTFHEDGGNN